ncbi:adenylyl cyclase-associated protein 1 [Mobula birostris]|uniref:adenylyl cyclase-associated protein 1 n=1 Tax=Mobula birostris TaxID=1983395 RepID=UPI003B27CB94
MANMEALVQRLEKAVLRLETIGSSAGSEVGFSDVSSPYVEAFDEILAGPVATYYKISKELGGDVEKHADMVNEALKFQRGFLVMASQCQQPPQAELTQLLQPLSSKIMQIQEFREKNRGSSQFNHLSAISESILGLGWLAVAPKPGPYVKEMMDAAMFYTNRILKEYKDTDKKHVEWVKAYISFWTELQAYIKANHTTGLLWNKNGRIALASCSAPASGGAPPPPPGPPPPSVPSPASKDDTSVSRSALFAELNKGTDITSRLKHVPDSNKTHKNPALRSAGGTSVSGPKPFKAASPTVKPANKKGPPVLELQGKKWMVENQENASNLVIQDTELKQVVYVYKCAHSTVTVKGKINSITVDNCKKLGLVFDDVVGIVEVINSRDVKIQVLGKVPTISVNKTDGCHIYLSKDSLSCEVISAKSSEMNILIPEKDDFVECPVPEQFKTVWNGEKLVTTVTEISG